MRTGRVVGRAIIVTVLACVAAAGCTVPPPPPPQTGSIAGTVTSEHSGAGLGGVTVEAFRVADGLLAASTATASASAGSPPAGSYELAALPAGSYHLRFSRPSWVTEYWDDAGDLASATGIVVNGGAVQTAGAALVSAGVGGDCVTEQMVPGADFTGADLAGCDLSARDLSGATFTNANLAGARFVQIVDASFWCGCWPASALINPAALTAAKVDGADLTGALLTAAQLKSTDLDWTRAVLDDLVYLPPEVVMDDSDYSSPANANGVDFSVPGAHLESAQLRGLSMEGANFSGADLTGTDMGATTLRGANFSGVDLAGTDLTGATIAGADLTFAVGLTVSKLLTTNTDWKLTLLPDGFDFGGADLAASGHCLSRSHVRYADLSGVNLTNCDVRGAYLDGADVTGADLTSARLRDVTLTNAVGLTTAQLLTADHDWTGLKLPAGVDLSGVDFAAGGYTLSQAVVPQANLAGANLAGVAAAAVDIRGSDLTGANLTGTIVQAANLEGVIGLTGPQLLTTMHDWQRLSVLGTNIDLSGTDFTGAGWFLTGVKFGAANLSSTDFAGVQLSQNGSEADLTGADLAGADLTGTGLTKAKITGADLSNTIGLTKTQLAASNRDWTGTGFAGTGLDLSGTQFVAGGYALTGADLSGVNLTNTWLRSMNLTGTDLTGATIAGANLENAVGLTRDGVLATNHDWSGAYLGNTGVSLAAVDFTTGGFDLRGTSFWRIDLTGSQFDGMDLTGTVFVRSNLSTADLGGATGTPTGGSTATYATTTCPDGAVTNGTTVVTCVGHGLAP